MKTYPTKTQIVLLLCLLWCGISWANSRVVYSMDTGWKSVFYPEGSSDSLVIEDMAIPYNWNDYYDCVPGIQNRHGEAVYQLRFQTPDVVMIDKRLTLDMSYELCLEGVGTSATIVLNGDTLCCRRPIGFVSATFDVTKHLRADVPNELTITCHHPSSLGNGPLGLFRRVSLIETDPIHIIPNGVHSWTNFTQDTLYIDTEVRNDNTSRFRGLKLLTQLFESGKVSGYPVTKAETKFRITGEKTILLRQAIPLGELKGWSPGSPVLYNIHSVVLLSDNNDLSGYQILDAMDTPIGFHQIRWPLNMNAAKEGEIRFGQSYAFDRKEVNSRLSAIRSRGYNALQEAGAPHALSYGLGCARRGMYYIPLFFSSRFEDLLQFRQNFKSLLRQWVREHRNNPAVVAWGLQDESRLPADFVAECHEIIRQMDPLCCQPEGFGRRILTLSEENWVRDPQLFELKYFSRSGEPFDYQYSDSLGVFVTSKSGHEIPNTNGSGCAQDSLSRMLLRPIPGMQYLYRYNCGGDSLMDSNGNLWMGDDTRFSHSWSARPEFSSASLSPVQDSYGQIEGALWIVGVKDTLKMDEADARIMSSYRWGRHDLSFSFPVDSNQHYCAELFFVEPFASHLGEREFDVEISGQICLSGLDICQIVGGPNRVFKVSASISTESKESIEIHFPRVKAGQAVLSAIAISRLEGFQSEPSVPTSALPPVGFPYSEGKTWEMLNQNWK